MWGRLWTVNLSLALHKNDVFHIRSEVWNRRLRPDCFPNHFTYLGLLSRQKLSYFWGNNTRAVGGGEKLGSTEL